MYICTLEKIDMETFKMKVSKMIAVCLIVENFRFCVILRGCRSILDIIYIYVYIHTHILTYNIPGSSQLVYQFAVFQFSSPPKNIGSTRAEEIFCRKEFFLSSAVWGWSSGYVSRLSLQQIFYPPRHFLWDTVFFWGGRWIRQNYGCYVLREHAKLLTFKWAVGQGRKKHTKQIQITIFSNDQIPVFTS